MIFYLKEKNKKIVELKADLKIVNSNPTNFRLWVKKS